MLEACRAFVVITNDDDDDDGDLKDSAILAGHDVFATVSQQNN